MDNIYDQLKPKIFESIAQRLKDTDGILEIGCGNCQLVNYLAQKTGNKVVGLDITNTDFNKAKEEAQKLNIPHLINYIKGDAEKLFSFVGEKFGAIVLTHVLYELEKPARVLKEVKRY